MAEGFTGPGTDTSPASTYKASGARGFVYDGSTPPNNGDLPTFDSTAGAYKPAAPSGGGAGGVQVATVTLSSADILALSTTPKVLVPAPGAGKRLVPVFLACLSHPGGTLYSGGNAAFVFGYDGIPYSQFGPGQGPSTGPFLESADSNIGWFPVPSFYDTAAGYLNTALVLSLGAGDGQADGDGTLDVTVGYVVA